MEADGNGSAADPAQARGEGAMAMEVEREENEGSTTMDFEENRYGARAKEVAEVWNLRMSARQFAEDIDLQKAWLSSPSARAGEGSAKREALRRRMVRYNDFESHDYDTLDNQVARKVLRGFGRKDYLKAGAIKWATAFSVGLVMGVVAFLINYAIMGLNRAKYQTTADKIASDGGFGRPFVIFVGMSVGFLIVAGYLVCFVEPLAGGSGIPELKIYLNGIHLKSLLCVKTFFAKVLGVLFSISGGLIAGKEGPFIHAGGIVGGGFGTWSSNTFQSKIPSKYDAFVRNFTYKRDFVGIGTAVGVATAFSAPIGGMLFTVEEGATYFNHHLLWKSFLATAAGVVLLQILTGLQDDASNILSYRLGNSRDFGLYEENIAVYGKEFFYYLWEIPFFMLIGAGGGLAGALFVKLNVHLTYFRRKLVPQSRPMLRLLEVVMIGMITNIIFFSISYSSPCDEYKEEYNEISRAGTGSSSLWTGRYGTNMFPELWCPSGTFSRWGQLFYQPLAEALKIIIHIGEDSSEVPYNFNWLTLLMYFLVTFTLMVVTYGVGAATGLFVPSLVVGAAAGRLIGKLVKEIVQSAGSNLNVSLSSYAVIGAASSLGGATRMTISITVLVAETTGAFGILAPIMVAVFFSKLVGDMLGLGIYDAHIRIRGAPMLEEQSFDDEEINIAAQCTVRDVMAKENIVALPSCPSIRDIIYALTSCKHGVFPIFEEGDLSLSSNRKRSLQGCIHRSFLVKLVKSSAGRDQKDMSTILEDRSKAIQMLNYLQEMPVKAGFGGDIGDFQITEEEMEVRVDLTPFMHRHPYLIVEDAPASRAYALLRDLGLRHIFVTPSKPQVVGLLSRKDLLPENMELALEYNESYAKFLAQKNKTV